MKRIQTMNRPAKNCLPRNRFPDILFSGARASHRMGRVFPHGAWRFLRKSGRCATSDANRLLLLIRRAT
jgi:hypothetical protein